MKALSVFVFLFTVQAFAETSSLGAGCLQSLAAGSKSPAFSESELKCFASQPGFPELAKGLCTAKGDSVSESFEKFYAFQSSIDETLQSFLKAKTTAERTQAGIQLQQLQQDQAAFARANGLYALLQTLGGYHAQCRNTQPDLSPR